MNSSNINPKLLQFLNIVTLVFALVMNALATTLPLNGISTEAISDALPSFFTPAGYTFAIWGLIYSALIGFAIYQALPSQRSRPYLNKIGFWFVLSSLANGAWIAAWHYGYYPLSVGLMLVLLGSLITIYIRLNIGKPDPALTTADKLLYQAPFSLYLGWITVATIANIASVAGYLGWNGFGIAGPTWAIIMIFVAVLLAAMILFNRRNAAYAGVLVWALFGIRAARLLDAPQVGVAAVIAAVLIAGFALLGYWRTRPQKVSVQAQSSAG